MEQLLDMINGYEIKVGDIVEVRQLSFLDSDALGFQGVVVSCEPNNTFNVKFPAKINDYSVHNYVYDDLRVIYKADNLRS